MEPNEKSIKPTPAAPVIEPEPEPEARPRAAKATGTRITAQAWECSACGKHLGYPEVDECPCGSSVSP